jgi:tripartite-type tricarboxylate transporter receptor subunit TctC
MKKIIGIILSAFVYTTAIAADYNFIIPNPPGSSSDVVARAIAHEYTKNTGNTLVFDYAPGGDHIVAATKFQNISRPAVLLGSTTMHVFNHVTKDSIPYKDADFDHAAWIGWTPHIWYVKNNSPFLTLDQVVDSMKKGHKINVGVDGLSTQANVISIKKMRNDSNSMEMVIYKGSPQVLADVLGEHVDIGVASLSSLLIEQANAGNIRVLATTNESSIVVAGKQIPTASKILGVNQFNGGFLLSVSSKFDTEENRRLKNDLFVAANSQYVKDTLAKINIFVNAKDGLYTQKTLVDYRKSISILK